MEEIGEEPKIKINFNEFEFPNDMRVILSKSEIITKGIKKIQGVSSYHYLTGKRSPPISFIKEIVDSNVLNNLLITNKVKFGHGGNAANALLPSHLNPKLAYLVGALRDGNINSCGKYELSYIQKNIKWLNFISELIVQVFNPSNKPKIIIRDKNTPKVIISNKPICEFFKIVFEVPIGKKEEWSTPNIILKSSKEIQKYYIKGYFDADGICGKHLGFCQLNFQSLKDLKTMLKKFNINCTNTISVRKLKSGKKFYSLYIKKEHWNDFFMKIGSSNSSKFTRFVQN
ncbi:MAG: LAGLIDADG family homing endonuclease [Candidatus Micrarchaeia archaeon]|jgi:hypothetical protein